MAPTKLRRSRTPRSSTCTWRQARFVLAKAPAAIDLSRYVTLPFLEKIDPAIKHKLISAADATAFKDKAGTGNDNPDRKWCTGPATSICIESTYKFEGKIPMGIMLVNQLRDRKKVVDHIDFRGELAVLAPSDLDQVGLQELAGLDTPVTGTFSKPRFWSSTLALIASATNAVTTVLPVLHNLV